MQNLPVVPLNLKDTQKRGRIQQDDFQDEQKMKELMANVVCMSEKDIQMQEEQLRRWRQQEQKRVLQRIQSKYARQLNPELHRKTHMKAAQSLLMNDTKVMSVERDPQNNCVR